MSNQFAPNGFADAYRLGAAPNYQQSLRRILPSNTTPIYRNDPIVQLSSGYIAQATPGTTQIGGIFIGCEYTSISQKKRVWLPNWSGLTADVSDAFVACWVVDDPEMVFKVQGNGLITQAMVGLNAQFAIGTGNTVTGISGASLDTITTPPAATATLPFRIVNLIDGPPGQNGTDTTSAFNMAYVAFNNQDYKSLTGI